VAHPAGIEPATSGLEIRSFIFIINDYCLVYPFCIRNK